jgi:shikimate kinase
MRTLMEEREPFYLQADHKVDAEYNKPEAVAAEVMELARKHGGWFARS